MPAFSLFAILAVASLRLRLQNRCGLGLNRNLPFLDGHCLEVVSKLRITPAGNPGVRRGYQTTCALLVVEAAGRDIG
jgi:hypothetical protein